MCRQAEAEVGSSSKRMQADKAEPAGYHVRENVPAGVYAPGVTRLCVCWRVLVSSASHWDNELGGSTLTSVSRGPASVPHIVHARRRGSQRELGEEGEQQAWHGHQARDACQGHHARTAA